MSNKRHKHNVKEKFVGDVPKYIHGLGDHITRDGFYHPTKGWRKLRKETNWSFLNKLLSKLNIKEEIK